MACVVFPNVTQRTQNRIAQRKRVRVGSLDIVLISHKWRQLVLSWRMVCILCDVVFTLFEEKSERA